MSSPASRLAPLVLLASLNACAGIAHGTRQVIPVVSNPPGARVLVNGDSIGVTPMHVSLRRGKSHRISVSLDSAPPVDFAVRRQLSGWLIPGLFLYYVPVAIDFASGAAYNLAPDSVNVDFPGARGIDVAASMGLAPGRLIRLSTPGGGDGFTRGVVDSVSSGRLFWRHWVSGTAQIGASNSVALDGLPRLQLHQRPDRRAGGVAGMKLLTAAAFAIPMVALSLEGLPEWGLAVGAIYSLMAMPVGYLAGAVAAPDRWSPLEARKVGSPLLVDDRVRLRVHDASGPIAGRLVDVEAGDLLVKVRGATMRVSRASVQSIQRADGRLVGRGMKYGMIGGAVVSFVSMSMCNCKTSQEDMMIVPLAGAFLGLLAGPALAPRRWSDVLRW